MEKIKKIYFPVYDYTVLIVITEDVLGSAEKRGINCDDIAKGEREYIHGLCSKIKSKPAQSFIFLSFKPIAGDIAHECSHVVHRLFDWTGMTMDDENVAYHLGYLTQQVYDFITLINKKK